jgi:hypothetical protein
VVLLFRGVYPRSIFDLVLGLNRWVLRVGAYAAVMTPEYPPFRLDPGGDEPGGLTITRGEPAAASPPAGTGRAGWTGGRVTAVVLGSVAALIAVALLGAGGTALVFDRTQRDAAGYLMTGPTAFSTPTYALVSDGYRAGSAGDWFVARDVLGTVRIRTTSGARVFVGVARASALASYLGSVRREVGTRFDARRSDFRLHEGGAPPSAPAATHIWAASAVGAGTTTLEWKPRAGTWRVVLMNADASAGVNADLSIGARLPHLLAIGIGLVTGGALLLLAGGGVIYGALGRART